MLFLIKNLLFFLLKFRYILIALLAISFFYIYHSITARISFHGNWKQIKNFPLKLLQRSHSANNNNDNDGGEKISSSDNKKNEVYRGK